jgi:hypothetical protein
VNETFFLCFGYPKSGTTFLQRMLDLHPQVSCPAEQSFSTLTRCIENDARAYNEALKIVDRRTGGQGAPVWSKNTSDRVFAAIIRALAKDFAKGKSIYGLNDNSVAQQPKFYDEILDRPRMIAIFRNPVDQALSAWRHNARLAQEEPHMASVHLGNLQNREGTVEGYVMKLSGEFVGWVNRYFAYVGDRPNFLTLRYESLVEDKQNELLRLFQFVGADASASVLETIVVNSSKERMASRSKRPEFFGVGGRRSEVNVSPAVRERALAVAARGLERLGYDVNSLLAAA